MTTLPQTSPMRLPRPASSHLAIPSAGGPMGPVQPVQGQVNSITLQDVWRVIRANLLLIIAFVAVSAVGGYLLNQWLLTHYPRYTSTILISVRSIQDIPYVGDENGGIKVSDASPQSTELEQQSQAGMITSKYFLGSIIDDPNSEIRKTNWFKQFGTHIEEAKEELGNKLEVYPRPSTRLISVSMSTGSPQDSLTIVREVVNRHVSERTDNVLALQYQQAHTLKDLIDNTKLALTQIKANRDAQAEKMAKLGASGGNYQLNGVSLKMAALVHDRSQAQTKYREAKDRYDAFVNELGQGGTPLMLTEALSKTNSGGGSNGDQTASALEAVGKRYGRDSIQYQQIQAQLDSERKQAEEREGKHRDEMIVSIKNELARDVATAQKVLDQINEDSKKVDEQLQEVSRAEIADSFHHRPDKAANRLAPVWKQLDWLSEIGFDEVDCGFKVFELAVFGGRRP